MKYRYYAISLLFLIFYLSIEKTFSQVTASDCGQAINVCTNLGFSISPNGFGSINEVPALGSAGNPSNNNPGGSGNMGCLRVGERNSTWMIININSPGVLEFNFGGTQQNGYYDWSMWPYNNNSCTQIPTGSVPPVRCNWNGRASGGTGLAATVPSGGHASNFEPPLNVNCGDRFIICFSNFSSVNTTVPLNFFGTAGVSCAGVAGINIQTSVTPSVICAGQSVTMTAQGGTNLNWTPSTGLNSTTASTVVATPNVTTTYKVVGMTPCGIDSGFVTVTVNPVPVVTLTAFNPMCINDPSINLSGGLPAGGTYSGPGVVNGVFNPQTAGVGTHTITYTYSNGSCSGTATRTIVVSNIPPPPVINSIGPLCCGSNPINLTGTPTGGSWTGVPITNSAAGILTPSCFNAGTHVLTYRVFNANNCSNSATTTVVISPSLTANAGNNVTISSGQSTNLSGSATGGTGMYNFSWTPANRVLSPNTNNTATTPLTASQTYNFTVTDAINCQNTDLVNVIVTGGALGATISANPTTVCPGGTVQLNVLPSGGSGTYTYNWTANTGVAVQNISSPVVNPMTTTTYTVVVSSGGVSVSRSITITTLPVPNVTLNQFNDVCITGQAFPLSGGSPTGGTYSGAGIVGTNFNPQVAGVGTHTITYTVTGTNGCINSATNTIQVLSQPIVSLSNQQSVCEGSNPVTLTGGTPVGGTYFGNGVANGQFNPNIVGPGTYTIFYTYAILGTTCEATATRNITVNPRPNLTFPLPEKICIDAPGLVLNMGTPSGGTYSGIGIINGNVFSGPDAGFGTHNITYSYTSPQGCSNNITESITVNPLPVVTAPTLGTYCLNNPGELLPQGTPPGGIFSGPGITLGDSIFPNLAGVGTHPLTYQYTDLNNCTNTASTTTQIYDASTIVFNIDTTLCVNASPITLSATPTNGVFSGNGVIGNIFNPSVAGVGPHWVYYQATNIFNCISRDSIRITVFALPNVVLASLDSICYDANPIVLNQGNPSGGVYSGNGIVNNNEFDPSLANLGNNTIIYTYTNSANCTSSDTNEIFVIGKPTISHNPIAGVCISNNAFTLSGGNPSGGNYFGNGVTNNSFSPTTVGVGIHTVNYVYTSPQGCKDTISTTVEVFDLPTINFSNLLDVCIDENPFTLNTATPNGGIYSGNGVTNNDFSPILAGANTHTITYVFTDNNNCTNTDSATITVNPLPAVNFPPILPFCIYDSSMILNTATPANGTYSGNGINNGSFVPLTAGVGNHLLTYTFTDTNGCINSDTSTAIVNDTSILSFSNLPDICIDGSAFNLNTATPNGGTYSGNGVTNNSFDPASAGEGTSIITYTYTNPNQCTNFITAEIEVNELPIINFGNFADLCIDAIPLVLNSATPINGDYSGNGVYNNIFYPDSAGAGNQTITYIFTDSNNCTNSATANILINPLPVVNFPSLNPICVNEASFNLNTATPSGGNYSGNGVSINSFNPSIATVGNHLITYTYTDTNSCVNSDTSYILVNDTATIVFNNLPDICVDGSTFLLQTASPSGGVYSGNGVDNNNNFSPSVAGVGLHVLTYTFTTSNNCVTSKTATIRVNPLPVVNFNDNSTICIDHPTFDLITATPSPGVYSGIGVNNNRFNPAVAGVGVHTLTYTFTDNNGCINSDNALFTVNALPNVVLPALNDVCLNQPQFVLNTGTPFGGIYSGNGVVNSNSFRAINAGVGIHKIVYTYTDLIGCVNKDSTNINVLQIPNIVLNASDISICNGDTTTLIPSGGINYSFTTLFGNPVVGNSNTPVSPAFTTSYILRGENNLGCANRDTIEIIVNQLPSINVSSPNPSICLGDLSTINAGGGVSYVWSPQNQIININNSQITVSPSTPTTYFVVGTDANGCSNRDSITINIFATPTVTATATFDTICKGEVTTLQASGAQSYIWLPNQNLSNNNQASVTANPLNDITYSVTGTSANGCKASANISITVVPLPQLQITSSLNDTLCIGQSVNISVSGASTYNWTPSATLDTSSGSSVIASPTLTTTYLISSVAGSGCKKDTTITIPVHPPLFLLSQGNTICLGDTGVLTSFGAGGNGNLIYTWTPNNNLLNPNSNNALAYPNQTTTYTITLTDNCGTTPVSQQVEMQVLPLPIVNFSASPLSGCAPLSGTLNNFSFNTANCVWTVNNQFFSNNCSASFDFQAAGQYTVSLTIEDNQGCINSDSTFITVFENPIADFFYMPDSITILNPNVIFNGSISSEDVTNWDWEFSNLGFDYGVNTSFMFPEVGIYPVELTVFNDNGCKDSIIYYIEIKDDYAIYIPNAFTPNGDGLNDTFGPIGVGIRNGAGDFSMKIFNRWGQLIYETEDLYQPWNGIPKQSNNSELAPIGVYSFRINLIDILGNKHQYIGKVTLIR
jgi:gliding motility-associated-like protein